MILSLAQLREGESGVITRIGGHGAFRKRITEMGFVRGQAVKVMRFAPLQDPVEYHIMGYNVSLRLSEANLIEVAVGEGSGRRCGFCPGYHGTFDSMRLCTHFRRRGRVIRVALVGNPNCGKTTLYNRASGSNERVGNYSGVTVDARSTLFHHSGYSIKLTDLPGTYSITEYTPEELYVRDFITNEKPDIVINVVDASNLERNLYLTTQLIDMDVRVVMALNMYDELLVKGVSFDYDHFSRMTGIPVIPTIASKGSGIGNLFDSVIDVYNNQEPVVRHININYGLNIESAIDEIVHPIEMSEDLSAKYSPRYLALKLLENDSVVAKEVIDSSLGSEIMMRASKQRDILERDFKESSSSLITDARYGFISGALAETYKGGDKGSSDKFSVDSLLTNRYLGFPFFIFFMWLMFQATFTLGSYPMDLIDAGVGALSEFVRGSMGQGIFRDLLADGIISGVGGVLIFLPNILILFLFISIMEDTGYMARASFIMDRIMHRMGLHGKSFIPLLMGFGCNVPAIMATRTLESKKDRIITILVIPFMSCSARLPIYVLITSAFFASNGALVMLSVYLAGVIVAVLAALVLKRVLFRNEDLPFVMELPPYRIPTLRNTLKHMWHKGGQYLKKMGTTILAGSLIIWALGYFPLSHPGEPKESYIETIGKSMEPIIEPLGFNWKGGVSIVSGLVAKEIVVSTMGVLYEVDENDPAANLQSRIKESGDFDTWSAFGFMIFILLYFPCVATLVAIGREAGWRWAVGSVITNTTLAWIAAFLIRLISRL